MEARHVDGTPLTVGSRVGRLWSDFFMNISEHVPYGSAYGLENLWAQDALRDAAVVALDEALCALGNLWHHHCIEDLAENHADADSRRIFGRQARHDPDLLMVLIRLPEAYVDRYASIDFLKNWVVTLSIVGWKLAQADRFPLTSVAEELALHTMIEDAIADVMDHEPPHPEAEEPLRDLYDDAFEDTDFLVLFDLEDPDDLGDLDPEKQMGLTDLRFKNWFRPFGSGVDRGVPHPFVLE
jgi:hypothetical protein